MSRSKPAHDLARSRLRQIRGKENLIRSRDRADLLDDVLLELVGQGRARLDAFLDGDERRNRLALDLVWTSDHSGLGDLRVIDERALDFHRAKPMPCDVEHVVDAAEQPEEAILVEPRAVAGEVRAVRPAAPVLLDEAFGIAVDAAQHGGPRPRQRQQPAAVLDALALSRRGSRRRCRETDASPIRAWCW